MSWYHNQFYMVRNEVGKLQNIQKLGDAEYFEKTFQLPITREADCSKSTNITVRKTVGQLKSLFLKNSNNKSSPTAQDQDHTPLSLPA